MPQSADALAYGRLDLNDAHAIARGANTLLMAMQEYSEERMASLSEAEQKTVRKGVALGDTLIEMGTTLTARGVFSTEKYLSELLIYSAAVVAGCEVCALTHIEGAVRSKVPPALIEVVQAVALYIRAQADDDTYLLFDAYQRHWSRFAEWPRLSAKPADSQKLYNLIALLMSLVVRKRRLVRFHTAELLRKSSVKPEEILEIVGIAQAMGGFPARWEAVHILDVILDLALVGALPPEFVALTKLFPAPKA
jgi:alkylhydroperoxidase/carboxymuconolactone decarboxylase family protein YurZ